jgi:hypothetical protein
VILLIAAVVGGLLAGRLRPRAGIHAHHHRLRGLPLLAVALVFHVVAVSLDADLANLLEGGTWASLACFAGLNLTITGAAVAGVGLVLNLVGIVVNNGTPVRLGALVDSGQVERSEVADLEIAPPRHLETPSDRAPWLGDVLPVDGVGEVLSFGDLIALVGLADGLRDLARRRARQPDHPVFDDQPSDDTTRANVDHDWGTAPKPAAESASQYSANPDSRAAETKEFWRDAKVTPSPAHLTLRQDK